MVQLKEGKEYKFIVEKELRLPDNSNHFMLKGPDGKKYLIPADRYSHYGIVSGKVIKCRIDRINCKGEIFLEPENPWYTEGKSYMFIVDGIEVRTDNAGINHNVVVVTDKAGNKISVSHETSKPFPAKGTKINLKVERITKGKIHLTIISGGIQNVSLTVGRTYEFAIERIEKGMDDEEYFVIMDPYGNRHTLARVYYEHYGFTAGTRFRGKVIKHNRNGVKTIEPANPFYKTGSVVRMGMTGYTKSIINQSFTLDLKDKFGFIHCMDTDTLPVGNYVRCRVIMIRKGKPQFELL